MGRGWGHSLRYEPPPKKLSEVFFRFIFFPRIVHLNAIRGQSRFFGMRVSGSGHPAHTHTPSNPNALPFVPLPLYYIIGGRRFSRVQHCGNEERIDNDCRKGLYRLLSKEYTILQLMMYILFFYQKGNHGDIHKKALGRRQTDIINPPWEQQ